MKIRFATFLLCGCLSLSANTTELGILDTEDCYSMEATAYCLSGTMCRGGSTRLGVCATMPKYYGYVAMVYKNDNGKCGDFIGYYECLDTGGSKIQNGKVIDLWMPTDGECFQFGRQRVIVKFIKGDG